MISQFPHLLALKVRKKLFDCVGDCPSNHEYGIRGKEEKQL